MPCAGCTPDAVELEIRLSPVVSYIFERFFTKSWEYVWTFKKEVRE